MHTHMAMTAEAISRSSVVEKTILHAAAEGKDFSILVVDSRPMLEGKNVLCVHTCVITERFRESAFVSFVQSWYKMHISSSTCNRFSDS